MIKKKQPGEILVKSFEYQADQADQFFTFSAPDFPETLSLLQLTRSKNYLCYKKLSLSL